jgi:hypothetical protein
MIETETWEGTKGPLTIPGTVLGFVEADEHLAWTQLVNRGIHRQDRWRGWEVQGM